MLTRLLLAGLLLEIGLGLLKKTNALLICFCIISLIPAGAIKFNVGINLNSFNLSIIIIIFLCFPLIIKNKCYYLNIRKFLRNYSIFVIVTTSLSYVFSDSLLSFAQNILLFFLEYIMLGFCLCYIKIDHAEINKFYYVLLFLSTIIVSYAFINYIIKINPYIAYLSLEADIEDMSNSFLNEERGILEGRVSSVFQHPLHLGQYILLTFSFLYFELKNKIHIAFYIIILILLFLTAVLTGSRSSLVPIITIPIIELVYSKKSVLLKSLLFGGLICVFLYSLLPSSYKDFIDGSLLFWNDNASSKANIQGSSVASRTAQFEEAFSIIQDDILLGKGIGYIKNHGADHPEMLGYESIFLSKLIEGGVLGLIAFLYFYFTLYRSVLKRCKKNVFAIIRVHSLCLPFLMSICMTGISYSFFTIFMLFFFYTVNIIDNQQIEKYDSKNNTLLLVKRRSVSCRDTKMH